jgi:ubiquinone/menaquinone biosynthesis C-methylase UbiE
MNNPEVSGIYPEHMHKGFDDRIVRYEVIHQIEDSDYKQLVVAVDAQPNDKILDGCCGYGEVAKRISIETGIKGFQPEFFLLDESPIQLNRALGNIPGVNSEHITNSDIRDTSFPDNFFNKVVIKMGIHELPRDEQSKALQEVFRILNFGGRFITWELALDVDNQLIFQDIIRKKDSLAGFEQLVQNRYFPRLDEMHNLFAQAGFQNIENFHSILYRPSMLARKEELVSKERKLLIEQKGELTAEDDLALAELGLRRAGELTEYARQRIPNSMKEKMKFQDLGNDIRFEVQKMIVRGSKPE